MNFDPPQMCVVVPRGGDVPECPGCCIPLTNIGPYDELGDMCRCGRCGYPDGEPDSMGRLGYMQRRAAIRGE